MKHVYMLCALLAVLLTACTTTTTNDVRVNPEPIPSQPLHPMAGVPSLQEQAGQRTAADSAYLQADAVPESVTTGKAGGLTALEPLKAVYLTDQLTTIRWSPI